MRTHSSVSLTRTSSVQIYTYVNENNALMCTSMVVLWAVGIGAGHCTDSHAQYFTFKFVKSCITCTYYILVLPNFCYTTLKLDPHATTTTIVLQFASQCTTVNILYLLAPPHRFFSPFIFTNYNHTHYAPSPHPFSKSNCITITNNGPALRPVMQR